jgi:hypothetical protein
MGTRADFFVGIGPDAEWLGSTSYDGDPGGWGQKPLAARTEGEFRNAVEEMLSDHQALVTRPSEGWPWPWNDFRTSDYAYAWDPARGTAVASSGRAWVTSVQMAADLDCIYTGEHLRDDEVPDMRKVPKGDVLGKSGLLFLRVQ